MLELNNLTVGYKERIVVRGINVQFRQGEITTIIGKNGSGKSTLLKSVASLIKPLSGSINLGGKAQQGYKRREWAQQVAFLSQSHTPTTATVQSLVFHGRYPHLGFSKRMGEEDYFYVDQAIKKMGIEHLRNARLHQISGGERQKAYLAMALAQNTPYIAFDEPATYLDLSVQKKIVQIMQQEKEHGSCIIAVMHDLSTALWVSDYVCLLDEGEVVAYGKPEELIFSASIAEVFGLQGTKVGPRYLFY